MKTWSKYIILILTIFAIFLCKGETVSSKTNHYNLIEQLEDETECLTTDFSDSYHHQHLSIINTQCSQKNTYRRDNGQRHCSHFIKTNKITTHNSSEYTIDKFAHKNATLSEPSYRLIRLGKLII